MSDSDTVDMRITATGDSSVNQYCTFATTGPTFEVPATYDCGMSNTAFGGDDVSFTWNSPSQLIGTISYKVDITNNGGTVVDFTQCSTGTSTECDFSILAGYRDYQLNHLQDDVVFTITAISGDNSVSQTCTQTTAPSFSIPPTYDCSLNIESFGGLDVDFTWNAPDQMDLVQYDIKIKDNADAYQAFAACAASAATTCNMGLSDALAAPFTLVPVRDSVFVEVTATGTFGV